MDRLPVIRDLAHFEIAWLLAENAENGGRHNAGILPAFDLGPRFGRAPRSSARFIDSKQRSESVQSVEERPFRAASESPIRGL